MSFQNDLIFYSGEANPSTPKNSLYLSTIFSYAPYQQTCMSSSWQLLKENSHDYIPKPTMKSKDFRKMEG
jgi:hypothetical protein